MLGASVMAGVLWIAAVLGVEQYYIAKVCGDIDIHCKSYYQQRCPAALPCENFAKYYEYKRTVGEWRRQDYLRKYPTQAERDREFQEFKERLRGKPEGDVRWQSAPGSVAVSARPSTVD